jgi:Fic family protein
LWHTGAVFPLSVALLGMIRTLEDVLHAIDGKKAQIDAASPLSEVQRRELDYRYRLEWNFHSNTMEGSPLTYHQTKTIMQGLVEANGQPIRYITEMKGHDDFIAKLQKASRGELRITERFIKEIHRSIISPNPPDLLPEEVGHWKKRNNEIINYRNEKEKFTSHEETPSAVNALINWLDNQYYIPVSKQKEPLQHPLVIAAEFHLRFIKVHPFFDGNGRTVRILVNTVLMAAGFPPLVISV